MRRIGSFDERSLPRDGNRFLEGTDFETKIEDEETLGADANGGPFDRLEAGHRNLDAIRTRLDGGECVFALSVAERRAGKVRVFIGQRDRRARHAAAGIANRAAQPTLESLTCTGLGTREHEDRHLDGERDTTQHLRLLPAVPAEPLRGSIRSPMRRPCKSASDETCAGRRGHCRRFFRGFCEIEALGTTTLVPTNL